jgi:hypothetical protein
METMAANAMKSSAAATTAASAATVALKTAHDDEYVSASNEYNQKQHHVC